MNVFKLAMVSFLLVRMEASLPADQPVKVLFIGNSQMQCYDLPEMVRVMSESATAENPRIVIGRALFGGKSLKGFWEMGEGPKMPRAMIAASKWDYVVIQEIYNGKDPEFQEYATKFDNAIRKAGAKTILLATASVTQYYSKSFRYPEAFQRLNDMQIALGRKKTIPVAAAGYAWMKYLGANPPEQRLLDLYHKDKGHPGAKGTYIYACCVYAAITGKSPVGLTSEFKDLRGGISIPKDESLAMQKAAWQQHQETNGTR